MNNDIQRASRMKRFSAYLVDVMALVCVATLVMLCMSALLGYDSYSDRLEEIYEEYEALGLIQFEDEEPTPEEIERYNAAVEKFNNDEEVIMVYGKVVDLTLLIVSVGILLAYVLLEVLVPLWLGNGQTFGKKIFGIALMRIDGVKITTFMLLVRSILGKCVVETMIPALIVILMLLGGSVGAVGLLIIGLLLLAQVILLFATKNRTVLHDMLACTIAVDMESQRIFDSPEARTEFIKRISAENAAKAKY